MNNIVELSRETMISKLIDDEIDNILTGLFDGDNSYISDIFNEGFKGYQNFTDLELEIECNERFPDIHKIIN